MSHATFNYQFGLNQLIVLGLPAAKALTCLEANKATLADVYIFWHAFVAQMVEVLEDKNRFPPEVVEQIYGIVEYRHEELFDGGRLSTYAYLAATYLNPGEHSHLFPMCNLIIFKGLSVLMFSKPTPMTHLRSLESIMSVSTKL